MKTQMSSVRFNSLITSYLLGCVEPPCVIEGAGQARHRFIGRLCPSLCPNPRGETRNPKSEKLLGAQQRNRNRNSLLLEEFGLRVLVLLRTPPFAPPV